MNSLESINPWIAVAVFTTLLLAGFGIFARWCAFSPAVPVERLNQLAVGMTTENVRLLLGPPRLIRHIPNDMREWVYGASMKRHVLMLQFGTGKKLQSFAHSVPGGHIQASAIHN